MRKRNFDKFGRYERKSGDVEKIAHSALLGFLSNNEPVAEQLVKKNRILTKYGKYLNVGEDIFGLFDSIIIPNKNVYLTQITDNQKRSKKPYKDFVKNLQNPDVVSGLCIRVKDDGYNIAFKYYSWRYVNGNIEEGIFDLLFQIK